MNCTDLRKALVRPFSVSLLALIVLTGCGGDDDPATTVGGSEPPAAATSDPTPVSANGAPVIAGTPGKNVKVGSQYTFAPVASDPDSDTLAFSIQNRPTWAQFDTVTGRLTGKPGVQDVGKFAGIAITVSDGKASKALAAFAIAVEPAPGSDSGSATLSWMAPTENIDGSPLTDLAGYEVYFGKSKDTLDQKVTLTNPSLSTYIVENLEPGTWYFALTAVNQKGVTSELSNIATRKIS